MSIRSFLFDKSELVFAIAWLVAAIAFGLLIILPVRQYKNAVKGHDDYISVTYTYQSNKFNNARYNHYYRINVKEEEKPLQIAGIYLSAVDKDNLSALRSGDIVQCYVEPSDHDDFSFELVEMYKGNMAIITLEDRNKKGRNNAIIGLVFLPIMSVMLLSMSIYHFVKFFKER